MAPSFSWVRAIQRAPFGWIRVEQLLPARLDLCMPASQASAAVPCDHARMCGEWLATPHYVEPHHSVSMEKDTQRFVTAPCNDAVRQRATLWNACGVGTRSSREIVRCVSSNAGTLRR